MSNNKLRTVVRISVVAALYVALTLALYPLSYGAIQFRVSESLMMLISYNPIYAISLSIGCLISNLASPMGVIDVVYGTLATIIASVLMIKIKNKYISSLIPTVVNAIVIGLELKFYYELPLFISMLEVALGEFVVVTLIGVPLFKSLEKNKHIAELLEFKTLSSESLVDKFFNKKVLLSLSFMIIGLVLYFNLGLYNIETEEGYDIYSLSRFTFNIVNNNEYKYIIILLILPILSFISCLCLTSKAHYIASIVINLVCVIVLISAIINIQSGFKESQDVRFYFYFVYFLIIIIYDIFQITHKENQEELEEETIVESNYSNL